MSGKLKERCRDHVLPVDDTSPHEAVLAVLRECKQIRTGLGAYTAPERAVAEQIERVIAETLGLTD